MTKQKGWEIKPSGGGMKMCFLGQTPCCWSYTGEESESERANENENDIKPRHFVFFDKHPVA